MAGEYCPVCGADNKAAHALRGFTFRERLSLNEHDVDRDGRSINGRTYCCFRHANQAMGQADWPPVDDSVPPEPRRVD